VRAILVTMSQQLQARNKKKEEIMKKLLLANTKILPQITLSFNLKLDAGMLDLLELHRRTLG
jgi:hypothetical protein